MTMSDRFDEPFTQHERDCIVLNNGVIWDNGQVLHASGHPADVAALREAALQKLKHNAGA